MPELDPCAEHEEPLPQLVRRLRQAAELEQQFMCMYLYGAFSIQKRYVDGQRFESAAHMEITRRWASTVYLVARQEMEHLALVNNLLRSVGAARCFARRNLSGSPLGHFHLGATPSREAASTRASVAATTGVRCDDLTPLPQRFALTRLDLDAVKRWTCMEAPSCEVMTEADLGHFAHWCFERKRVSRGGGTTPETVSPGTIEQWYARIAGLFDELPPRAYVLAARDQVDILQQYDVFVFPVTDGASARRAIDLITKQGEGIGASPSYQSHYRRFFDIVSEWESHQDLRASWELLENPGLDVIDVEFTRTVFTLFNEAYEILLTVLTGLYGTRPQQPDAYPYRAPALGQEAFAPYMTMVIRSLAEVLVQLRAVEGQPQRVGPDFHISSALQADLLDPYVDREEVGMAGERLKDVFGDIDLITDRVERLGRRLEDLSQVENPPVIDVELAGWAHQRLGYIASNVNRIAVNLRRIYQQGIYSALQAGGY